MANPDLIPWTENQAAIQRALPKTARDAMRIRAIAMLADAKRAAPRRKGELVRSLKRSSSTDAESVTMPAKYAPIEFGGEIRPKRSAFLAVPIVPAARSFSGPRSDGDLFVVELRDGRRFLGRRSGGGIQLRWKLESSVRVRGRGFLTAAHQTARRKFPAEVLGRLKKDVLGG